MYFKLDEDKIRESKYTKEDMEAIIRNFVSKKKGIEIAPLTFQHYDELAVGTFANIFSIMIDDPDFLACLAECQWNINGKTENCLSSLKNTLKNIKM